MREYKKLGERREHNDSNIFKEKVLSYFLSNYPGESFWLCDLPPVVEKMPPFSGFMGTRWGISVDDAKKMIETEGKKVFEDRTHRPPHVLYASGTHLNSTAIFSYFFTPKSKKLYRVDVTFKDISIYQRVKEDLIKEFKTSAYSQPGIDHWSWTDKSLLIFQRDPDCIQISYSGGEMLKLNQREGDGLLQ